MKKFVPRAKSYETGKIQIHTRCRKSIVLIFLHYLLPPVNMRKWKEEREHDEKVEGARLWEWIGKKGIGNNYFFNNSYSTFQWEREIVTVGCNIQWKIARESITHLCWLKRVEGSKKINDVKSGLGGKKIHETVTRGQIWHQRYFC